MAHSDCGWTCGCAGKTVKSLENTCHTWARLRWWFTTKRRYIKCVHLYLEWDGLAILCAWELGGCRCQLDIADDDDSARSEESSSSSWCARSLSLLTPLPSLPLPAAAAAATFAVADCGLKGCMLFDELFCCWTVGDITPRDPALVCQSDSSELQ